MFTGVDAVLQHTEQQAFLLGTRVCTPWMAAASAVRMGVNLAAAATTSVSSMQLARPVLAAAVALLSSICSHACRLQARAVDCSTEYRHSKLCGYALYCTRSDLILLKATPASPAQACFVGSAASEKLPARQPRSF
jgi:hypothetical protein